MKLTAVKTAKKHLYFNDLAVRRTRKLRPSAGRGGGLETDLLTAVETGENRRHINPLALSGGC